MAIDIGIGDGTRIFGIPSLSIICIYVDRSMANLVKSCTLSSKLPRTNLAARRLAGIANTCLEESFHREFSLYAKTFYPILRNTA